MDQIIIEGGAELSGSVQISGSKNAALPIMVASLLTEETLQLTNIPNLSDILTMIGLLDSHGVAIGEFNQTSNANNLELTANNIKSLKAPYDIVRKMRASIWVLGPLVARFGSAEVSLPGGCAIGARMVDQHIEVIKALGAKIDLVDGYIIAKCPRKLQGTQFRFDKISVGATITGIMAATLAKGTTRLLGCAKEPEIVDLCHCLVKMGAKIKGIGTSTVTIEGVEKLHGAEHKIIYDRIEAGSYIIAGAITKSEIVIENVNHEHLDNFIATLQDAGVILQKLDKDKIIVKPVDKIMPLNLTTSPYPGFVTDMQAHTMALMTLAHGTSVITENIFENRFMHVPELCRMGANIEVSHNSAIIRGGAILKGADVMATDLRASMALVLAGLAAKGTTKIHRIYHLDRGYADLTKKLEQIGAKITRTLEELT